MTDLCLPSTGSALVDFALRARRSAAGVVLEVVGEVDVLTAPLVLEAARHEIACGARALVLDLAEVSFCSARCLGTIIDVRRLAERHGASACVARASDEVRRIAGLARARELVDAPAAQAAPAVRPSWCAAPPTVGRRRRALSPPAPDAAAGVRAGSTAIRQAHDTELLYGWPVLLVLHDADGVWHLLPTVPSHVRELASGAVQRSSWARLTEMDATLQDLVGLPRGWLAAREHCGRPWRRQPS